MIRLILAAALLASPALAFDPAAMTEAEKEAFGQAVRDYLVDNPHVIFEALAAAEGQRLEDEAAADLSLLQERAEMLFGDDDPVLGNPDGDVTLVVFTDYRCPFCAQMEEDLNALTQADPNLRLVHKEYPILTPDSAKAAAFALAVWQIGGAEAYAEAHHRLYNLRGGFTEASFGRLAEDLGLPKNEVLTLAASPEVATKVGETLALGREFGLDQTPSFVLPHLIVRGAIPAEVLQSYVNDERTR